MKNTESSTPSLYFHDRKSELTSSSYLALSLSSTRSIRVETEAELARWLFLSVNRNKQREII